MVSAKEIIAIIELIVYVPFTFLTFAISFRHGFHKQLGWIYLTIFCVIRAAGAGIEIYSIKHPTDISPAIWAAILGTAGLAPLLQASIGLLKRVYVLPYLNPFPYFIF
jgi:hypothetical protein